MAASSIFDASYLVSAGIERLILEWKVRHGEQMDKKDGSGGETNKELDPDFSALLQRAGSATYKAKMPKNMDRYEYHNLISIPFGDGSGDTNEWNLFDKYLRVTSESLADPHNLSAMIEHWETDVVRCPSPFIISSLTSAL